MLASSLTVSTIDLSHFVAVANVIDVPGNVFLRFHSSKLCESELWLPLAFESAESRLMRSTRGENVGIFVYIY
jgi:hypothetical protein